ncbi:hypothetical protein BELL_1296g00020 [Botrytis elliptica]|uniref:Transcription factor domain-containing protein n=1 Tax=Botrytis elliptica TaxID=278938 RepID=A0A4Z1I9U5_9HELO|nr:hypothetical protein BELL_1296g00020 [Botrytis elliptica]
MPEIWPRNFPQIETKQSSQTILVPKPLPLSFRITLLGEQEAIYFQIFQRETINSLADGRKSPVWHGIVRHACLEEPSIFHCAIAIAALDQACKSRSLNTSSGFDFHHRHALQQYGKALKELQKVVARGDSCIRTTLISSLLIFCFQNFHGDVRLAINNVRTTIDLMYDWISSHTNTTAHIGFSPAPHILEHEVVEAFARLDAHLLNWIGVSRSSCDVIPLVSPNSFNALPIPTIFTSLKEAKLSFDNIISRLFLDKVSGPTAPSLTSISQYTISEASEPPFAKELRSWTSAFQPIFDICQSLIDRDPKDHSEFIPAGILRCQCLALMIVFWSSYYSRLYIDSCSSSFNSPFPKAIQSSSQFANKDDDKEVHKLLIPVYSEIITTFRAIVNHPAFVKSFIFECGILPQLFVVICKCPDEMIRREAKQILKDAEGRREGIWNAKTVGLVGADILRCEDFDEHVRSLQNQDYVSSTGNHLSKENFIGNNASAWDDCKYTRQGIRLQKPIKWVEVHFAYLGMKMKLPDLRREEETNNKQGVEYSWERYNDEVEGMHLLDWVEQYLGPRGDGLISGFVGL